MSVAFPSSTLSRLCLAGRLALSLTLAVAMPAAAQKGKPAPQPTSYPVTIEFDDAGGHRITSDGGSYQATIFTGNGTASFDITNSNRSVTLDFGDRVTVGSAGLASAPSGLLSASGSVGLIDLGQVGSSATARYVRITLVGTAFRNDTLGFRRVTSGSSPTVVDGTPVCAVKTGPGVWRVSTLPTSEPAFASCQTVGDPPEAAGEIGAVFRSVKNSTVKVANYRMPFSLTVRLDCTLVPGSTTGAAATWCQYP